MMLSGSPASASRTCAAVGRKMLSIAQSAPWQWQPSAVRMPWPKSLGVSRGARVAPQTSACCAQSEPSTAALSGALCVRRISCQGCLRGPSGQLALEGDAHSWYRPPGKQSGGTRLEVSEPEVCLELRFNKPRSRPPLCRERVSEMAVPYFWRMTAAPWISPKKTPNFPLITLMCCSYIRAPGFTRDAVSMQPARGAL